MNRANDMFKGAGLLLLATVLWGGMFPIAKVVLQQIDAFYLNTLRYGVTAVAFVVLLLVLEGREALRFDGKLAEAVLFGAIGFAGFSLFAYVGLAYTQPEHGAVIMATQPMLAALVRWIWQGRRPPVFTMACILAAFAGVFLVITRGQPGNLATGTSRGDLLMVLGAFSWVVYTLASTRFAGWSPLRYTTLTCLTGEAAIAACTAIASLMGAATLPSASTLVPITLELGYLTVFASIVAVLAWNSGIVRLGPLSGMLFINLVPITAFLIGLYNGKQFVPAELLGAGLVMSALVANNMAMKVAAAR